MPSDDRFLIEKAAAASGQSLTDFAVSSLVKLSYAVIENQQITQMTARDRDVFLRLLKKDSKPNAALRSAAVAYKKRAND